MNGTLIADLVFDNKLENSYPKEGPISKLYEEAKTHRWVGVVEPNDDELQKTLAIWYRSML